MPNTANEVNILNPSGSAMGDGTTPVRVDPTGTTPQPVSGTVTANVGSTNGLALDATLTGGTAKEIVRGGQKGATNTNADITHTAEGADHEALDVQLYHGGAAKDPTQIRALTSTDVVTVVGSTAPVLVTPSNAVETMRTRRLLEDLLEEQKSANEFTQENEANKQVRLVDDHMRTIGASTANPLFVTQTPTSTGTIVYTTVTIGDTANSEARVAIPDGYISVQAVLSGVSDSNLNAASYVAELSSDSGKSWTRTLIADPYTGATRARFRNPDNDTSNDTTFFTLGPGRMNIVLLPGVNFVRIRQEALAVGTLLNVQFIASKSALTPVQPIVQQVTTNGTIANTDLGFSKIIHGFAPGEVVLNVNIGGTTGAPSAVTFKISEVDAGDGSTSAVSGNIAFLNSASTAALSSAGYAQARLIPRGNTGIFMISWTNISGGGAGSYTGVYITLASAGSPVALSNLNTTAQAWEPAFNVSLRAAATGGSVPFSSTDLDTGGGVDQVLSVSLRSAASGGSVALGSLTNPIIEHFAPYAVEKSLAPALQYNTDGGTLDANFWTSTIVNSATATQGSGSVALAVTTNSTSSIKLVSNQTPKFQSGSMGLFAASVKLSDNGIASNTRRWGVANSARTNGLWFELSGTQLRIATGQGAAVSSASWNGVTTNASGTAWSSDLTNYHRYEIVYDGWLIYWIIDGYIVHSQAEGVTALAVGVNVPLTFENTNAGSTTVSSLNFMTAAISRAGGTQVSTPDLHTLTRTGMYFVESGRQTVLASAHAATAGFFWLINPVASTALVAVRKISISASPTAATAFVTAPRITVERMTFTGTSSGTTLTPAKRDSNDSGASALVITTSTGLSLSAGAVVASFLVPAVVTAVGIAPLSKEHVHTSQTPDDFIVLRPGEGLIFRQADAGTTSDTRVAVVELEWEEY